MDPFDVVRQFERAVADYCGAPYCVSVRSCTDALLLAVTYHVALSDFDGNRAWQFPRKKIEIPKRTYVGVAHSIVNAGAHPTFRDEVWLGSYQLKPLNVYDCARRFTGNMYVAGQMQTVSFHHTKILGLSTHGGAILHDNPDADAYLRRARFDGRREGIAPKDDIFDVPGFHCYMLPPAAAEGLLRLASLPRENADLPCSDYSDLSLAPAFK